MAQHHIYQTPAVVVSTRNIGEADRVLELFTRQFGRISVIARGIRREHAKLRFVLQAGAWVEANLVRGKERWRLTTAIPLNVPQSTGTQEGQIKRNMLIVMKRLIPLEIPQPDLFDDYARAFHMLSDSQSRENPQTIETLLMVRMLAGLGYWGKTIPSVLRHHGPWTKEMILYGDAQRAELIAGVNNIFASL